MKIFKFLRGKFGKAALSATQAIAASAAVGIAGIGVWQFLGSDSNADNAFNSLGYQPNDEVVYVSGSSSGQYEKTEYINSSFRAVPSKAIEMQQREEEYLRQQELEREAAERAAAASRAATPDVKAQNSGGINEGLGNKKLESMTPEQIKALQAQTMQQAQDAVAAGKARADALAAQAGAGVSGAMTRSAYSGGTMAGGGLSSSAGGSASYVGMPGAADSGKNFSGSDGIQIGNAPSVYLPEQEGARIPNDRNLRAKPNFGATVSRSQNSQDFRNLELMAKRSMEIAGNEKRSANEAGRVFLASSQNSGGIRVENIGDVSIGQGASSDDFGDVSLSGLNSAIDNLYSSEEAFREERKALRAKLRKLLGYTFLAFACAIPYLGWLAVRGKFNSYFAANAEYDAKYGDRSKEAKAGKKIANKLKVCAKMGGAGLGLFAAMIPWMLADAFGWTTSVSSLKKSDDSSEQGRVTSVRGGGGSTGNEPGSTLEVQNGRTASDASRQEAQEYMQRMEDSNR